MSKKFILCHSRKCYVTKLMYDELGEVDCEGSGFARHALVYEGQAVYEQLDKMLDLSSGKSGFQVIPVRDIPSQKPVAIKPLQLSWLGNVD